MLNAPNVLGARFLTGATFLLFLTLAHCESAATEPAEAPEDQPARQSTERVPPAQDSEPDPRKPVRLPGIVVHPHEGYLDLKSTVCLEDGMLELIACVKGSKEHESVVAVEARPMHIHAALLVLGAESGHPAIRRPLNEEQTRWIDLPPRGDRVKVSLVVKDEAGKEVERPIGDFVTRTEGDPMNPGLPGEPADTADDADDNADDDDPEDQFPNMFLFAGSHVVNEEAGERKYLADQSGHVITIATFGDEVLCLPGVHTRANDALQWRVDPTHLPEVGDEVTLRLRPVKETAK